MTLNSRQIRTVRWLLEQQTAGSVPEISRQLRMSPRVVRSCLDRVERYLKRYGLGLERQRGVGVWLAGDDEQREAVRAALDQLDEAEIIPVDSASDRQLRVRFELLVAAPDPITIDYLQAVLDISASSARRDLGHSESWINHHGLFLARRPGLGLAALGSETAIRKALVELLLSVIPPDLLSGRKMSDDWWRRLELGAGIPDVVRQFPLIECSGIIAANETLSGHARAGQRWLAVYLAVIAYRIRAGRDLILEPGTLRSLGDHPVWESVRSFAGQLSDLVGEPLTDSELGGLTEHLLGMAELEAPHHASNDDAGLVAQSVAYAAEQLHPGLAEDQELLKSLAAHLDRLRIRVRYGLPVHNPLLTEVASRYADVHEVALAIASKMSGELGLPITDDEAGFITMYLSGALERLRLRPRTKAMIVCPAGIATAWILVSRIQAEFPELDLIEVVSADSFEQRDSVGADLIISTVEVESPLPSTKVVVVNPLLPPEDVRRISRVL